MSDCPDTGIEERIYSSLNPLSKEECIKAIDVLQKIIRKEMFGEIVAEGSSAPGVVGIYRFLHIVLYTRTAEINDDDCKTYG